MKTKFNGILTLLLAFLVQITFAQEKTISGTVSDDSGPLPGVNVIIKGTSNGTQTDFDGKYTINASTGDVLLFSYVGMTNVEKTVGSSTTIDVTMSGSNVLEEVVIMGYGSKKKSELTGSSVQIGAEDLAQVPVASIDQALQGRVAGLAISSTSGTPGSTQNIRIRGISSITAGNQPLYVIDGVPMSNPALEASSATSTFSTLSSINSNDVASITVLKDASATSAYGARGANGVIVITTKKGKSGKTTFNFNSSIGFSNDATDGPTVLTAAEREMLYYEGLYNTWGEADGFTLEGAQAEYEAHPEWYGDEYVKWNAAGRKEGDVAKHITNSDALQQEYNFSATGGDESSNFYTSLGLYNSDATVIGASFKRYTASLNFSKNLSDKITLDTKNSVSNVTQDGLLEQSAYFASPRAAKYFMTPTAQLYNEDGTLNIDGIRSATNVRNPLYIAQNDINESKLTRLLSNTSLKWETPIENLSFTTRMNIDFQVFDYKEYQNRTHGDGQDVGGAAERVNRNITNYVYQNSLDYIWNLDDDHKFDFKLLQEFQQNKRYYLRADAESFAADGLTNLASAGTPTDATSSFTDWSVASYLGMINYRFSNKYVANATYRREGSSRFPTDTRWGNFWSVGAAWNMHNEDFMVGTEDIISNLKLRASYGVSGNANIDLNSYQSLFSYDADYGGAAGVYASSFGNPVLSWETSHTLDAGIDFGLFDNRVNGSLSYYIRESRDLLQDVPLSRTTGFNSQNQNIGIMENKGLELELSWDAVRSEDFNLTIGGNIADNANKVLELALDGNGEEINIITGTRKVETDHIVYEWYMRKFAGVDTETGVNLYYANGVDGETTTDYNSAERAFQGKGALPTLTAGLNLHIDYKGFFLDVDGYYAGGHKVYEDWSLYLNSSNGWSIDAFNGVNTLLDRWQQPGDVTNVEKMTINYPGWKTHSKWLHDGDYFRLKNLTFGYDFNENLLDKIGVNGARIFVRGTNLYTWVKDDNLTYDPEVEANGFTSLTTPPVKTLSIGVNFKF